MSILSPRGVFYDPQTQTVVRRCTPTVYKRIKIFYTQSPFVYRPNILSWDDNTYQIVETYMPGKHYTISSHTRIQLATILSELHQPTNQSIIVGNYIQRQSDFFLASIAEGKRALCANLLFDTFGSMINNTEEFITTRTHGDCKADNIIVHNEAKKHTLTLIDRERAMQGHPTKDLVKVCKKIIKQPYHQDHFLNTRRKHSHTSRPIFCSLFAFHDVLDTLLQYTKNKISEQEVQNTIEKTMNRCIKPKITTIYDHADRPLSVHHTADIQPIINHTTAGGQYPSHILWGDTYNNQEQRLAHYAGIMKQHKDCIVFHGCCFETHEGMFAIVGPSGAGKTTLYTALKEQGLIKTLFDEDLFVMNTEGDCFALGTHAFLGQQAGTYVYEQSKKGSFGRIQGCIVLGSKQGHATQSILDHTISHVWMHERYHDDADLCQHYASFPYPSISVYYFSNDRTQPINIDGIVQRLHQISTHHTNPSV